MKSQLAEQDRYPLALLHQIDQPLGRALWCLAAADEVHRGQGLSVFEIEDHLRGLEVEVLRGQIGNALNRAGPLVIRTGTGRLTQFSISHKGRVRLEGLVGGGSIDVVFVEAGRTWSKPMELVDMCSGLKGELLVADPFYGEQAFLVLDRLSRRKAKVKFLTEKTGGHEKPTQLKVEAAALTREHTNLEVKLVSGKNQIHDRFILGDNGMVIVGAGLKDLGAKHSFIIHLDAALVPDMIAAVRAAFLAQWATANPI